METASDLHEFYELYAEYMRDVLVPTCQELSNRLKEWSHEKQWIPTDTSRTLSPSPIYFTETRIKDPEKVAKKILSQPEIFQQGLARKSLRTMNDTVAGRIVVYFLTDLPLIHEFILQGESDGMFDISTQNQPLAYDASSTIERLNMRSLKMVRRDTGYAAIHYVLRFKDSSVPDGQRPYFELQVRTLAQHVWAEIEHILGYKKMAVEYGIRKQFQILSSHLCAIDEHFKLLYEHLSSCQDTTINVSNEDSIDPIKVPSILNGHGLGCAQNELSRLLRILKDKGISSIGDLMDILKKPTKGIVLTFEKLGRRPTNFEIIVVLASLHGIEDAKQIKLATETQIKYLSLLKDGQLTGKI